MNTPANNLIRLYRYMSADAALRTVESRSFRIGRLHELNDPFEWHMGIKGIIPQGERFTEAVLQGIRSELNQTMGILCFSDTAEDPVLWSHYADRHRGAAFEVERKVDPTSLFKIRYTNERPVIDANELHRQENVDTYLLPLVQRLMFQKSPGWAYEREYRIFIDLNACDLSNGQYFEKIGDNYLTRVILGFRCPLEENYVRRCLALHGLTTTLVARAKMCPHSYTIKCE
jgi:hypothetical protein